MEEYAWLKSGSEVVLSLGLFAYFRRWLGIEFKEIKDKLDGKVSNALCKERRDMCSGEKRREIEEVKNIAKENVKDTFHHGHKGLSKEGHDVVSTRKV